MKVLHKLRRLTPKRSRRFSRRANFLAGIQQLESRTMLSVDYVLVSDSLDDQLITMQSRLTGVLNGLQTGATSRIPIVGDQLGRAANIVSSFRTEMREALESFGTSTPTELQLQTTLAEHLGSFLGDAGPAGIQVTDSGNVTTVEMTLHGSAVLDEVDISFDTGLPSLPISFTADGSLELSVGFALEVAFTIDDTTGVVALVDSDRNLTGVTAPDAAHPVVDTNSDLALFVSAGPSSDFNAKAVFGFVEGFATLLPGEANGLYATVLVSDLQGTPSVRIDGSADANLQLAGSFAGTTDDFPGISADFHFHWGLSSADPSFEPPTVAFDNVSLTFGTFLSNVLRPALEPIKDALDPLSPILTLLTTEVPGISDLSEAGGAGPIRILDLAVLGSNLTGNGPLGELAGKITNLLSKIDSIQLGSNISLPLGGFDLNSTTNGDLRSAVIAGDFKDLSLASLSPLSAANLNNLAQSASQSLNDLIDDLAISEDLKSELHGLNALQTQNGFQIGFPILNDPAGVVFNMLLGRDADLFFFQADAVAELEGSRATGLSFAGQPIDFFGQIDIDTHLRFAYDTFGLRQLIANLAAGDASHIVNNITDGFYINSDSYFKMAGAIGARFGTSVANVFPLSVSGGLFTQNSGQDPVHVYIEDPNADGKLRFNEFHLGSDNQPAAFKLTGELAAELNIEVGFPDLDPLDIFPAPPNANFNIAREVLVRFATLTPTHLASEPDGNGEITLFLGTNAYRRAVGQNQDDGDETFVIEHLRTNPNGSEDINIRAFGINQEIKNVRKIKATDQVGTLTILVQPGVTSDVDFDGGQGAAFLTYQGSGAANLTGGLLDSTLVGGSGPSILLGGAGDDTIVLGSNTNTVDAAGGQNTVILSAPIYHPSIISGGTGFNNELQIIANATTTGITAFPNGSSIDVGVINGYGQSPVHLSFSDFDTVMIDASFSPTNFTLGDLAAAGVQSLTIDVTTPYQSARQIDLDTRVSSGAADVTIRDYIVPEGSGAEILNPTTGLTTRLLGFHSDDTLTLRHHGGLITVEPLDFTGGHFVFDTSSRVGNVPDVINITTPARDNGHLVLKESFRDVLITLTDYSSFLIKGDIAADQLNLNVAAASSGANTVDIDANSVHGELNVYLQGSATAINQVTLSRAGLEADVSIYGQNTTSSLLLGTGELALIRHDVFTSNVQLTVDNNHSRLASILTLDGTSFGTWNIPTLSGVTPQLVFNNLLGGMTVHAGAGDRFQLDVTPANITSLAIDNRSMTSQDSVYTSNWSVPLRLDGNFSLYAGRVLHRDGTVERIKRLANVTSDVTFDYFFVESISSVLFPTGPSEVIFDGDLDPPGAHYSIYGVDGPRPFNFVHNETVGLSVKVSGYSQDDQFYIYMPGATVDANLQAGPDATFYLDGQARLAGTNPTAPNNITIAARYGSTTMTPLGEFNSLLDMFNDVYILGAMPQDSLAVNVPTNVVMSPSIEHIHNLAINPAARYEVNVPEGRIISWLSGARPDFFVFNNVDAAGWPSWAADNGNPPNPFGELPYGLEIPHYDANIEVKLFYYLSVNGALVLQEEEIPGFARYWQVDSTPEAVRNDVQLNASQLRGSFDFNVAPPDYDLVRGFLSQRSFDVAITQSASFNAPFWTWFTPHDFMRVAFGQSDIYLSKTHPELAVDINGGNQPFAYPIEANLNSMVVSPYAVTTLNVGDGVLANLRGNVTADQVQLEVDDRDGTQSNIIAVTSGDVSWFSSDNVRKTLTVSRLRNDFTLTGGVATHFAIESTPALAVMPQLSYYAPLPVERHVIVRNFVAPDVDYASPDIYLMGHRVDQPLDVFGNLDLFLGRRLNTDGSVQAVGDLSGVATFVLGAFGQQAGYTEVNYTYTGSGRGRVVYDGANFSVPGNRQPAVSILSAGVPDRAVMRWDNRNVLTFGGQTDLAVYAPGSGFTAPNVGGIGILINNPTTAAIRYFSNPLHAVNRNDNVYVQASGGPLDVTGRGVATRVRMQPVIDNANPNGDLRSLIADDVYVTNAALLIVPTNNLTPLNTQQPLVLSNSQLTGLTGGTVSFSNLASYTDLSNSFPISGLPGLAIGLPHYGAASLTVNGTPDGVITAINTVNNVPIGPTTINLTNSELWLGPVGSNVNQNSDPRLEFRTASMLIGDGDLNGIQGAIYMGDNRSLEFAPSGVTIDNHAGALTANATFGTFEGAYFNDPRGNSVKLEGLAPAPIHWKAYLTTSIDVLGSTGSHYNVSRASSGTRLFAGFGSTVDTNLAGLKILGAETVRVKPTNNSSHFGIQVIPDPARPAEITDLTFDSTGRSDLYFLDTSSTNVGMGRIAGGSSSQTAAIPYVVYESDNTHLTFLGLTAFQNPSSEMNVTDTPALTTVIAPGNLRLNVSATTNPLEISLAPGSQLNLGNRSAFASGGTGDMRSLLGSVAISTEGSSAAPAAIRFNSSIDPTPRSVSLNQLSTDAWTVAGMTPAAVSITGSQFTLALDGGAGNNSLVGPGIVSNWLISGANAGKLNQTVTFTGMRNVISGSGDDNILFKPGGSLAGNLDGGAGFDTLRYQSGMLTAADVIDLPNRIAPRVTGQALNLESSASFAALAVTNPGDQRRQINAPIVPIAINVTGGFGTKQYSATGLPDGISIHPQTGILAGTPLTDGQFTSINVTVTDDSGSVSVRFSWQSLPGLYIVDIPSQTANVNVPISLQVQAPYTYGGTLTYSATGLPPGLSINSATGLITGSVTDGAQRPESYPATIRVTDGTHSAERVLFWNVVKTAVIVNPGPQTSPETVPVQLALQVVNAAGPVTYSASGLPGGVTINSQTGVISGSFPLYNYYYHQNPIYNITVTASSSQGSNSTTFTWQTVPGLILQGVYDRTSRVGDNVSDYLSVYNYYGSDITTTVTGLPPGVIRNPNSTLTGALTIDADNGSPYQVVMTATNHTFNYTYQATFNWTVTPAIVLGNPGPQSSEIGDVVNISIPVLREFGNPLEFAATGLPLGLEINPQTGQITGTVQSFPYGKTETYVAVTATETNGGTQTGQLFFDWFVNSDPFIRLSSTTIPENSPNGTVVGTLSVAEPGLMGDFYITSTSQGRFGLSPDRTQIIVNDGSGLDFETNQTHNIVVLFVEFSLNDDGRYFYGFINITVTNVNEGDTTFSLSPATIPENSPGGTIVGELLPVNPADGLTFTYSLTNNAGGRFALNGTQLVVASGAALNYEQNSSHDITIEIEDSLNNISFQTFTVLVTNINEAPILAPIGDKTTNEQQLLNFVVTAADSNDDPPNNVTLSVTPLPAGATFNPETGQFSWTPSETQQGSYTLTFTATDDGLTPLSSSEQITVVVNEPADTQSPTVVNSTLQHGLNQRSYVDHLQLDFSEQVNLAELIANGTITSAVTLTNLGVDAPNDADVTIDLSADQFTYQFDAAAGVSRLIWSLDAFADSLSSLQNGYYRLVLDSDWITDVAGNPLNGDGVGGDDFVLNFHRLEGDVDGNAIVNGLDMQLVNAALGSRPGLAKWNINADLDRDTRISVRDRTVVARNDGHQIIPAAPESLLAAANGLIESDLSRFDANRDGKMSASDALVIINRLQPSSLNEESEPVSGSQSAMSQFDVNRDGYITALDALQVINRLGRQKHVAESEAVEMKADGRSSGSRDDSLYFSSVRANTDIDNLDDLLLVLANDQANQTANLF